MKKFIPAIIGIALITYFSMKRTYAETNNYIGYKKWESKTNIIFGASSGMQLATGLIVTNKSFGVIEAAKKGGINKIGCVDVKTTNYFVFQKVEVIVTGE